MPLSRSDKKDKYESIKEKIKEIYNKNKGKYGGQRITAEIKKLGIKINERIKANV